jgi:hypothetical protein
MVREIGKVVSVVNDDMVLIRSSESLTLEAVVLVYEIRVIDTGNMPEGKGKRQIVLPKGRLQVVMNEGEGIYLAERYRETVERVRSIARQLNFLSVETVKGEWSAKIDSGGIVKPFSKVIRINDAVGLED